MESMGHSYRSETDSRGRESEPFAVSYHLLRDSTQHSVCMYVLQVAAGAAQEGKSETLLKSIQTRSSAIDSL